MSERPTHLREEYDTMEQDFAPPQQHRPPAVIEPAAAALPSRTVPFRAADAPFGKVVEAIANVMAEIKPVEKLGYNKFHNYAHARIGDLNAELTPLMGKHGIVVIQNEVCRDMFDNGAVVSIQYEFTILHKSGEVYPERPVISGMARCRTQKESFDDKTFNKCHTAARKYFLIGLFQIPVSDEDDADASSGTDGPRQQSRPTRRPPSPDGKATPDVLPVIDGEVPTAWADRFKKAISQSDSPATVNRWYQANIAVFEKIKRFKDDAIDGLKIYNDLIDYMDQLEVKLTTPPADSISSGPQEPEKPAPQRQRRAPAPKQVEAPTEDAVVSEDAKLWLESLENAFSTCEDALSLAAAQKKHLEPRMAEFSQDTVDDAKRKVREHLARIEAA